MAGDHRLVLDTGAQGVCLFDVIDMQGSPKATETHDLRPAAVPRRRFLRPATGMKFEGSHPSN